MQGQFEYLQGDGRTPQGHQGIEFKSVPREKSEDPDFLRRVLEYLAPWFCNSLDWNQFCNWRVKCPTVTYLPHPAAMAGHRGMSNFHVVELFTIPSSLYRQPVTFCLFVLFLEGIPYLHFSLSFFKLITLKTFRTFHRWDYKDSFPEMDRFKRISLLFSPAASFSSWVTCHF